MRAKHFVLVFGMLLLAMMLSSSIEWAMVRVLEKTALRSLVSARVSSDDIAANVLRVSGQLNACQQAEKASGASPSTATKNDPFVRVPADIIGEPPDQEFDRLILNVGMRDGIALGNAVVDEKGVYVGRIVDVRNESAIMVGVVSELHKVTVRIATAERPLGMLQGRGVSGAAITYLDRNTDIQHGALVMTAEREGTLPAGLPIGLVDQLVDDPSGAFREARMSTLVPVEHLEHVGVLIRKQPL